MLRRILALLLAVTGMASATKNVLMIAVDDLRTCVFSARLCNMHWPTAEQK